MKNFLLRFRRDESGAAMVEYAVLMALVLTVAVATLGTLGVSVNGIFTAVNTVLGTVTP